MTITEKIVIVGRSMRSEHCDKKQRDELRPVFEALIVEFRAGEGKWVSSLTDDNIFRELCRLPALDAYFPSRAPVGL